LLAHLHPLVLWRRGAIAINGVRDFAGLMHETINVAAIKRPILATDFYVCQRSIPWHAAGKALAIAQERAGDIILTHAQSASDLLYGLIASDALRDFREEPFRLLVDNIKRTLASWTSRQLFAASAQVCVGLSAARMAAVADSFSYTLARHASAF
jgi:hypothetical protein